MDPSSIIPHYQPLPFPAPVWLLQTLLVVGFVAHAIPMNVVLGGTPLCAILLWLGRHDMQSYWCKTGSALAAALPLFISFAVTQGIVPLLFLQLLYGPMFYTSSILMAVPWLAVILLLMLGYYTCYLVIYRYLKTYNSPEPSEGLSVKAPLILFGASLLFLAISHLFTTNITLMLTPERWLHLYLSGAGGLHLPEPHQQLFPRWLHFLVAAVAVTGLAIGAFGAFQKGQDEAYRKWLIKKGSQLFVGATLVQIPVGIWFLLSLPREIMMNFLGGNTLAAGIFGSAMLLVLVALILVLRSAQSGAIGMFKAGMISALLLILVMSVVRHLVRVFFLEPYISPDSVPVSTQWDLLSIFVVAAVGLILYLAWLVRVVWRAYHPDGVNV